MRRSRWETMVNEILDGADRRLMATISFFLFETHSGRYCVENDVFLFNHSLPPYISFESHHLTSIVQTLHLNSPSSSQSTLNTFLFQRNHLL